MKKSQDEMGRILEVTMNYLAEIKAFYDRLEIKPLPSPAIALWHALMSMANKTGWQQDFTVAGSVLMLKSGLNAQAVKRARNRLEQEGFITWRSRSGNQSAIYRMNSLVVQNDSKNVPQQESNSFVVQNSIKNVPQDEPQNVPQDEPQSVPINKHKLKHKQNNIPSISPLMHFEDFWSAFPKKQRRKLTMDAYCDLILSGTVTEEELVKSAENYAEYVKINNSMIYFPNNFLKNYVFEDFLPEVYQKPEPISNRHKQTSLTESQMDQIEKLSQVRKVAKNEYPLEVKF